MRDDYKFKPPTGCNLALRADIPFDEEEQRMKLAGKNMAAAADCSLKKDVER
jgi:hypothetical protein